MIQKRKLIFFVSMLIVILSLSAVVGADNATDDTPEVKAKSNTYPGNSYPVTATSVKESVSHSFSEIEYDINDSNEVNLTKDYYFNERTDQKDGIIINNRDKVVINGNNHTIDASNLASVFKINSSNVVLKDIVFKNSNYTAIHLSNSNLTTNNLLFINDLNNSRAISAEESSVTSTNDRFIDNFNNNGLSIYARNSALEVVNATFTSKYQPKWAAIYLCEDSFATIVNSTFANITAKYAPAVYFDYSTGIIVNSVFENLSANLTAGAVAVKNEKGALSIINSSFINTCSSNNGGAVYADVSEENDGVFKILLRNSLFDSCYSMIGGAYVQLGGELTVKNTTFRKNKAEIEGGALYTSYTNLNITDSYFENNTLISDDEYYSSGGALFADSTKLNMNKTVFKGNKAKNGEDVYLYDSIYDIKNSYFNGTIYTLYDVERELENNTFNKKNSYNNTFSPYVYEGPGVIVDYDPLVLDESLVNSSSFNLVDYGLVSPVKNQGHNGACWAFGTVAALESAFLKATNGKLTLDISENNVQNLNIQFSPFGVSQTEEGSEMVGSIYVTSWLGVTNQEDDVYDEMGKLSPIYDNGSKYFVYDTVYLPLRENVTDNYKYKEALVKYGVIAVHVHGIKGPNDISYTQENTAAYYFNSTFGKGVDHTVALVGWDDNFPKEKFALIPPGDGAWILKNSWGTDWGENGYYYVSYYDTAFATEEDSVGYIINNMHNYERNYEYDIVGNPEFIQTNITPSSYINKYTAVNDELISAIGTSFHKSGEDYEIIIYVDDKETYTQKGTSLRRGFETITLKQRVGVKENHSFAIEVVSNVIPISKLSRQHYTPGSSIAITGKVEDLIENGVAILKAYTITDKSAIKTNNLTTRYNSREYLKVTYYDEKGQLLDNNEVKFIVDGQSYTRKTDEKGEAILNLNLMPGKYTVTIVNPVNLEKTNVTITILSTAAKKTVKSLKIIPTLKKIQTSKKTCSSTHKIYINDVLISQTNEITIQTLQLIFNQSFINGHLIVYIDGVLVFNGSVGDNIYTVILNLTSKFLGQHELKVEFTDNNNEKQVYTDNITLK